MLLKIFVYLLMIQFVKTDKSFTIVLDTTASMREEIVVIKNNIGDVLRFLNNTDIKNYILLSYNDSAAGSTAAFATQDDIVSSLRNVEVKGGKDCPEISLTAIQRALLFSKPYSYIYLFTDAQAKDYYKLNEVKDTCKLMNSQVFIFRSGKCLEKDVPEISENVYNEVAITCKGTVLHLDLTNLNQAFRFMKEISAVDWNDIVHDDFTGYKQSTFAIDQYTKNLVIVLSCQTPSMEILDESGEKAQLESILVAPQALVQRVHTNIGSYSISVGCQDAAIVTIFKQRSINFDYGFSPKQPRNIEETSSRPIPGNASYIYIALREPIAEMTSLHLHSTEGEETLDFEIVGEAKYIAQYVFITDKTYTLYITCRDITNQEIVKGKSGDIETQNLIRSSESRKPITKSTYQEAPLIDFGTNCILSCKVEAYPEPDIWWEDENGETLQSEKTLLEIPYVYISYVTIENVAENRTVSCKSKNSEGEDVITVEYYVNRTLVFEVVQEPADITVEYGKEGKLYCEVNAYPVAEIKWYHNDTLLEYSDNIQIVPEEHMLLIDRMTLDDTGDYRCEIANSVESRTFSASVYITGLEVPHIEVESIEIILKPEETKELTCTVIKGTPIPEVTWKFKKSEGKDYESMPDGVAIDGTTMEIKSATVGVGGVYVCEASNVLGLDEAKVIVKVQYPPKIKNDIMEDKAVRVDQQIQLACDVDAEPPATVHWDMCQDDIIKDFDSTTYYDNHYTDDKNMHHFTARHNDSGEYHCIAENSMGRAVRTVKLNVLIPPIIKQPKPNRLRVRSGDNVGIQCKVLLGNPAPTMKMEHTDRNLKKTILRSETSAWEYHYIRNVRKQHEGTYRCVAENTVGIDTIKVFLEVD